MMVNWILETWYHRHHCDLGCSPAALCPSGTATEVTLMVSVIVSLDQGVAMLASTSVNWAVCELV